MNAKDKILNGKEVSVSIKETLKNKISYLKTKKIIPHLAVIIVGDNPASKLYVASKVKTFKKMECLSSTFEFSKDCNPNEIKDLIKKLNNDDSIHGILVQLPLPKHINEQEILFSINHFKDVDGFHPTNQGFLMQGNPTFIPCTPLGCIKTIDYYGIETNGKNVVVIGRSNIVGKPIASLLSQNNKFGNATVTLCHSKTKNLSSFTLNADIIVAAVGVPCLIKNDMIKNGVHIIDVGINRIEDLSSKKGYKVVGDVDFDDVKEKCGSITPVPGGIGIMTVTMLLHNTIKAAENLSN